MNVVSRSDEEPLTLTTIEYAAFSPQGVWLATVRYFISPQHLCLTVLVTCRLRAGIMVKCYQTENSSYGGSTLPDNGSSRFSLMYLFTKFFLSYTLSTSVDTPHKDHITSLTFSPVLESLSPKSNIPSAFAVTTSLDTFFKVWVSDTAEREEEEDACGSATSWACRSVGYYHNLPCYESALSEDGSLVAINFTKVIQFLSY